MMKAIMPRKILLNLLTHLLLVGSVEGGEHLFGLSLLLALVPHHRDLVLQHLQPISLRADKCIFLICVS